MTTASKGSGLVIFAVLIAWLLISSSAPLGPCARWQQSGPAAQPLCHIDIEKHLPIAETFAKEPDAVNRKRQDCMRKITSEASFMIPGRGGLEFINLAKAGRSMARIT